jgi:hypothetical protein
LWQLLLLRLKQLLFESPYTPLEEADVAPNTGVSVPEAATLQRAGEPFLAPGFSVFFGWKLGDFMTGE